MEKHLPAKFLRTSRSYVLPNWLHEQLSEERIGGDRNRSRVAEKYILMGIEAGKPAVKLEDAKDGNQPHG